MKLVWSPETASKAYIDTVKSCELLHGSSVAELISAMAAGWNAEVIVETWARGGAILVSIGLAVAAHHTKGRHICIVPDEESRAEYVEAMSQSGQSDYEMIVGEPEEVIKGLQGIDFLVVDCSGNNDFARIIRAADLGRRGAVLVCKNAAAASRAAYGGGIRWRSVLEGKSRIVRSVFLPVGDGLDVAHVGAVGGNSGGAKRESRWIKRIDRHSGEEFVIRK
ncbi:hypothetical protein ABFX02_05G086900 [Erythranthe guttata]